MQDQKTPDQVFEAWTERTDELWRSDQAARAAMAALDTVPEPEPARGGIMGAWRAANRLKARQALGLVSLAHGNYDDDPQPEYVNMHAGYFNVSDPELIIAQARETLANVDYDTMVGRGMSGALIIPELARALGKRWMIVRKPDGSHASMPAVGELGHRWIFVDDFVESGETREETKRGVDKALAWEPRFESTYVGEYLYSGDHFYPAVKPAETWNL